jgi:hypothetical protein
MNTELVASQGQNGSYRLLNLEDSAAISSPYIQSGYKEDSFEFTRLDFKHDEVLAMCKMTQYYISGTDEMGFHLSIWTATAIVSQLSIIHAHAINDIWRKDYEALLGKFSMELKRPIRTPDLISLEMRMIDKNLKPSHSRIDLIRAAYTWAFDIEHGAFTGELKASFTFRASQMG